MASSSSSTSGQEMKNGWVMKKLDEAPKKFPQFDVVTDVSDHKFVSSKQSVASGSPLYKTIMKEWKILQKNLPETIYVRVYETRIELMRAVIIGPVGTPYQDGLFFFDIIFPADYPNKPPMFSYTSFGYRLNPNLYENGKICLSILNTWPGKDPSERWIPGNSTALQVLISLQGLVLNEKPYYNEPFRFGGSWRSYNEQAFVRSSYTKSTALQVLISLQGLVLNEKPYYNEPFRFGGSWRSYNEQAFVRSCYTMVLLMRTPLRNFENFIIEHFQDRSRDILTSCQVYMNGFLMIGQYQNGKLFLEEPVKVPLGLRSQLKWCYKNLGEAFKNHDPSLGGFMEDLLLMVETKKGEYKQRKQEKRGKSVVRRVFQVIKKVVTLKKSIKGNAAKC